MKRYQNIKNRNYDFVFPIITILIFILIWQLLSNMVPNYLLPSPKSVVLAIKKDFNLLIGHLFVTTLESIIGLLLGTAIGFLIALLMDSFESLYKAVFPLLVISQTIPTVAIAPLLVLWFGYGILPKVILIIIVTFFPITIGLLEAYRGIDKDEEILLKTMGADKLQIFRYLKHPASLNNFYAGLRISASYAIVGGVISEWLGGFKGLGVYMTRVKKSYSFDKMFAVIFIISLISLLLIKLVDILKYKTMPWEENNYD